MGTNLLEISVGSLLQSLKIEGHYSYEYIPGYYSYEHIPGTYVPGTVYEEKMGNRKKKKKSAVK